MERELAKIAHGIPSFEPFELENDGRAWAIVLILSALVGCAVLFIYQ